MPREKIDAHLVRIIRRRYREGTSQGALARDYVMSVAQIGKIVRREAWADVPDEAPAVVSEDPAAESLERLKSLLSKGDST